MMELRAHGYNKSVKIIRWRGAAALLLASLCWAALGAQARADEQFNVGTTPVVNVQLTSGNLTVKTWDRPQVSIVTDGNVRTQQLDARDVASFPQQVRVDSETVQTEHGPVTLQPTVFHLPQLQGASHNAIVARGSGNTTITIPRDTAMVAAHVRQGNVSLSDYRGVFVASAHNGAISLDRVQGTGFVEALRGPINATDSNFDRLQARTTTGNMSFRGCTSHQIEATSTYGSIMYDNGRFQPGLAHFQTDHGNIALGVRGGAQINTQTSSGHTVSSFHNGAQVHGGPNATEATVRGGGPVVTAASKNGSVYIYNGAMRYHPRVENQMAAPAAPRNPYGPVPGRQYAPQPPRQFAPPQAGNPRQYGAPPPPPQGARQPRPGQPQPPARERRHPQQPPW